MPKHQSVAQLRPSTVHVAIFVGVITCACNHITSVMYTYLFDSRKFYVVFIAFQVPGLIPLDLSWYLCVRNSDVVLKGLALMFICL